MEKLAATCGSILLLILCATTLAAFKFPPNMAIGLTLFAGSVAAVLALAIRLAVVDRSRPHH
jgi:hypothetical protein